VTAFDRQPVPWAASRSAGGATGEDAVGRGGGRGRASSGATGDRLPRQPCLNSAQMSARCWLPLWSVEIESRRRLGFRDVHGRVVHEVRRESALAASFALA
jgi:hypothetical protein